MAEAATTKFSYIVQRFLTFKPPSKQADKKHAAHKFK